MKPGTPASLWQELQAAGFASGDLPPAAPDASPWFIRVMLGVAGWIGACFLLAFVGAGLAFVFKSEGVAFVFGLIACALAGTLYRIKPAGDFAGQFALAVSLAGQGMILFALFKSLEDGAPVALGMALLLALLFVLLPNFIHRLWCAWAGSFALVAALWDWHLLTYAPGLLALAVAGVWLQEFSLARHGSQVRAGGYGLVLTLMGTSGMLAWEHGLWLWRMGQEHIPWPGHFWLGAALGAAALLGTTWRLLAREGIAPGSRPGLAALGLTALVALASFRVSGLAPALLILLLGFGQGNRILAGLGIVALLADLSCFYYSLESTLMQKSIYMALTGAGLLLARLALVRLWPGQTEGEQAHG